MSQHRPVTRSQTQEARRKEAIKREATSKTPPPETRRKQRRRVKKLEDVSAAVDQDSLEVRRQNCIPRGIDDGSLREYEKRRKMTHRQTIGYHVFIWGDGSMGQLGMPTDQDEDPQIIYPRELTLETRVEAIAAGGMHTLMLMEDGSLQSFGSNDEGALGRKTVGDVWGVDTAENEQMEQWKPTTVVVPDLQSRVQGVRCTDSGSFVWTEDGSVFGWGSFRSSSGLVGFSDDVLIQKLPLCVYKPASKKKSVTKLATGGHHVLALLKDGSVLSWGDGERGQLGRGSPGEEGSSAMLTPAVISSIKGIRVDDVFCGESTSFFKTASGKILACGINNAGQLGIAPSADITNDACPTIESSVQGKALFLEPTEVASISNLKINIKQISSGKRHTLVLSHGGCVYSFGAPIYGVLGRLEEESDVFSDKLYPTPETLSGLKSHCIVSIAAGQDCCACVDDKGCLWTFGGEHSGLTCVGMDEEDVLLPKLLRKGKATKLFKFEQVDFGGQHGVLLGQKRTEGSN